MKCSEVNVANYNRNDVSGRSAAFPWAVSSFQCKRISTRLESSRHCSHEIDVYVTEYERNRSIFPLTTKKMILSSYFETVYTIVEINDRS